MDKSQDLNQTLIYRDPDRGISVYRDDYSICAGTAKGKMGVFNGEAFCRKALRRDATQSNLGHVEKLSFRDGLGLSILKECE